ncbi:mannitol dehydrogenase family protein [Roseobacter sp. S98]|uniref:mannitol dehydrogenase family protein n=1 Tax=Roseobacter algicola (ex Choi et al. 2025) (nom. illeg.) TaxID=3092138 RepID=UPI0035C7497A
MTSPEHPASLSPETPMKPGIDGPDYDPEAHGTGIVHIGPGAFHRAHQAIFTDDVLARHGGDWRICGVSLRSTESVDALNRQEGRYSLEIRGQNGTDRRVIGSISGALAAARGIEPVLDMLAAPSMRIVSLTVTEKAYGILRGTGTVDRNHPAISADLARPDAPEGVVGLIVAGLARRKAAGLPPYTVLCCDNLPSNGALLRAGVLDFAAACDAGLAAWIAEYGAFPSTMVDRITPAATPELLDRTESALGARDAVVVETEPFSQWVVEDAFCNGRPRWEDAGVLFVPDVAPYEKMKLRMLNGTHSLIAYAGFLCGHTYVRDVMADAALNRLATDHMRSAAGTLPHLAAVDFDDYARALQARFENPAIAHETYQIAMDGSQKMPQRIFEPAMEALGTDQDAGTFAIATAAWMRYCAGTVDGRTYALRDPLEADIRAVCDHAGQSAAAVFDGIAALPSLMPQTLSGNPVWRDNVVRCLSHLMQRRSAKEMRAAFTQMAGG